MKRFLCGIALILYSQCAALTPKEQMHVYLVELLDVDKASIPCDPIECATLVCQRVKAILRTPQRVESKKEKYDAFIREYHDDIALIYNAPLSELKSQGRKLRLAELVRRSASFEAFAERLFVLKFRNDVKKAGCFARVFLENDAFELVE